MDKNKLCEDQSRYIKKKENCKLIYCDNLNLSQKRNLGASIAKSKYILFSDDDDIWEINKGELTIESLKNNQVVCHEFSKFGSFSQKPRFIKGKKKKNISILSLIIGGNIFGGGTAIAAWKEIIIAIPFNEKFLYCEDYEWWIRVLLAEIKIEYIPKSLVKYRVHSSNMTSNLFKIYSHNSKIIQKLIYKWIVLFLTSISLFLKSSISFLVKFTKIYPSINNKNYKL